MAERTLTILNYHYVRPLSRTRFPDIKGCDLSRFETQIEYVTRRHQVLDVSTVIMAVESGEVLPNDAALLTFDDGFSDHFDYVLPVLSRWGITGCFFPPVVSVLEHRVLDVHKAHFILASGASPAVLCEEIDAFVEANDLGEPRAFASEFRVATPRDHADVVYVKRMLQRGLASEHRSRLASQLFRRFVTTDEAAFAEELYCSIDQLRLMSELGMAIGSHGCSHQWMSTLTPDEQEREIACSIEFLDRIDSGSAERRTICYPYGDHNATTRELARRHGFRVGFADHHGVADLSTDDPFALPRVSTSDFYPAS